MQPEKGNTPEISVKYFLENSPEELGLQILSGENGISEREISSAGIQKLGLALAGFSHYIHRGRIQIIGQSEISYLRQLDSQKRTQAILNLDLDTICCILITKNLEPPPKLIEISNREKLPILSTELVSSAAIGKVSDYLQQILAPQITIHGVLMEIFGIGVLISGKSGIGKSELALDLITRNHIFISDDSVLIKKIGERLEGSSPEITFQHLEIRGLGIINVRDLFGVSAIAEKIQIQLLIELKKWDEIDLVERLGLDYKEEEILKVKIKKFVLPVSAGRNLSTLIETAIRVHLLRIAGFDAAESLIEKHSTLISNQTKI